MRSVIVNIGPVDKFFAEIRKIARSIDTNEPLKQEFTLTFEEPGDMFTVMSLHDLRCSKRLKQNYRQ